jgi:hypothetical protein
MWKAVETFTKGLKDMITGPPPLTFVFISGVLVLVSLASNRWFEYTWALLIYSLLVTTWRYAEKDIDSQLTKWLLEKYDKKENMEELKLRSKLIIVVIYHLGNAALLVGLVVYLLSLNSN